MSWSPNGGSGFDWKAEEPIAKWQQPITAYVGELGDIEIRQKCEWCDDDEDTIVRITHENAIKLGRLLLELGSVANRAKPVLAITSNIGGGL